jgi:hypothetical protein
MTDAQALASRPRRLPTRTPLPLRPIARLARGAEE